MMGRRKHATKKSCLFDETSVCDEMSVQRDLGVAPFTVFSFSWWHVLLFCQKACVLAIRAIDSNLVTN